MMKVTTTKDFVTCVFCGKTCSISGQLECSHLESISLVPASPEGRSFIYTFRFREDKKDNAA